MFSRSRVVVLAALVTGCHTAHVMDEDSGASIVDAAVLDASPAEVDGASVDGATANDAGFDAVVVDASDGGVSDAHVRQELVFGRCLTADAADCLVDAPGHDFLPLEDGAAVPMVAGAQGATMFVFGVRAWDIDPGDPDDLTGASNPVVNVAVHDGAGRLVAELQQRLAFRTSLGDGTAFERVALFLVLQVEPTTLGSSALQGVATVQDRRGIERRGELRFSPAPAP